jgi:hypothetical protein
MSLDPPTLGQLASTADGFANLVEAIATAGLPVRDGPKWTDDTMAESLYVMVAAVRLASRGGARSEAQWQDLTRQLVTLARVQLEVDADPQAHSTSSEESSSSFVASSNSPAKGQPPVNSQEGPER